VEEREVELKKNRILAGKMISAYHFRSVWQKFISGDIGMMDYDYQIESLINWVREAIKLSYLHEYALNQVTSLLNFYNHDYEVVYASMLAAIFGNWKNEEF